MRARAWMGVVVLSFGLSGVWDGGRLATAENAPLSPREAKAQELLDRLAREMKLKRQQNAFLADHYYKTALKRISALDYAAAKSDLERALALNPHHDEAIEKLNEVKGILDLRRNRLRDITRVIGDHTRVSLQLNKMEMDNRFEQAKKLLAEKSYEDAIDKFHRSLDIARWLEPYLDVSYVKTNARRYIEDAQAGIKAQAEDELGRKRQAAKEQANAIRDEEEAFLEGRIQTLLTRAESLYEQDRYDDAREMCDQILEVDPRNPSADSLRAQCIDAKRRAAVARARKARVDETEKHWEASRAYAVPYFSVMTYAPDWDEIKRRKAGTIIPQPDEPWKKDIEDALKNRRVSFDFVDTPLEDVITFLNSIADVNMVLDPNALAQAKDVDMPVTLKVQDMRLESALQWILRLVSLKYALRDEAIFISDDVKDESVLKMYPVTDLTAEIDDFEGSASALESGGSGGSGGGQGLFEEEEEEEGDETFTGEGLVLLIRETIAPDSWDEVDE